jgi:hypothetical protein
LLILWSFGVAVAHHEIADQTPSIAGSNPMMTHVRSSDEEVRELLAYGAR